MGHLYAMLLSYSAEGQATSDRTSKKNTSLKIKNLTLSVDVTATPLWLVCRFETIASWLFIDTVARCASFLEVCLATPFVNFLILLLFLFILAHTQPGDWPRTTG